MLGNFLKKAARSLANEALKDFQWFRKGKGGHWEKWRIGHPVNEERWYQIDTRSSNKSEVVFAENGQQMKLNNDMEKLEEEDW